jgi:hypothetical protein
MSEPRDLNLERLSDRDGRRHPHLGEIAHVGSSVAGASCARMSQAAYEALIDAVFTAPGASAWLSGMRRAMAAMFAGKDSSAQHVPVGHAADPRLWRP